MTRQMKWFFKYGQWIKVKSNPAYQITEFHFFSSKDEEIKL
jgi:ribonuclease G